MRCFWDERQRGHAPAVEFFNGALHPAAEHLGRVDAILAAIGPTEAPRDHGMAPLLAVHTPEYLALLETAHRDWRAAGRDGDAFPYTFPIVGRRPLDLDRIDARLGMHSFDTATPLGEKTWDSAYWGAQAALAGLDAVLADGGAA
ncbi:MAG: histone deacetylase family protein, partial [Sphingomicrobium sp.]